MTSSHATARHLLYPLLMLPCVLMLAGCPDSECEGSSCDGPVPLPIESRDSGMTTKKDMDTTDLSTDLSTVKDDGMTPQPDLSTGQPDAGSDADMGTEPEGVLLTQTIISDDFGSPSDFPTLTVINANELLVTVLREPGSAEQRVGSFRYANGTWQAELPFADAMGRNARELLANTPYPTGESRVLYRSVAEENYYLGAYNGDQWESSELTGVFSGVNDFTVHALLQGGANTMTPAVLFTARTPSMPDKVVAYTQTGPTRWENTFSVPTRNADWHIDEADAFMDREGKIHTIINESKIDTTFSGGKDSQLTYIDPDDLSSTQITTLGAYQRRPTILSSVNGRLHIFYRESSNKFALPINTEPYDLLMSVREPGAKQWSNPVELRRQMYYYKVVKAPDDTLVLLGTDTTGAFFIRRYRNRSWNNLRTIQTDFPAVIRSDMSAHMDLAFDEQGVMHVIYRTGRTASLAYFSYKL